MKYGEIIVKNGGLSGIVAANPLDMSGGNIYADTLCMRKDCAGQYNVQGYLRVIQKHEDGAYCINTNINTTGNEYSIINYGPHLPESSFSDVLAGSFDEFLTTWYFGFLENSNG